MSQRWSLLHSKTTVTKNIHFNRMFASVALALSMTSVPVASQAGSLSDLFSKSSQSSTDSKKPLPVNQAFQVETTQQGNKLTVKINVTPDYYTYKDKLKVELPQGVTASAFEFDQTPTYIDDPDFGRVPVFEQTVTATATLSSDKAIDNQVATVKWQGCAKAGLCYPPEKVKFNIEHLSANTIKNTANASSVLPNKTATTTEVTTQHTKTTEKTTTSLTDTASVPFASTSQPTQNNLPNSAAAGSASGVVNEFNTASTASSTMVTASAPIVANGSSVQAQTFSPQDFRVSNSLGDQDTFGLKKHTPLALLLLFLAGLGLAFTPCVLPMLPIVANIVARQHNPNAKKGLLLTGAYGIGVATSYGILGAIVAVFGQSLGLMNMLQNPAILLGFAVLFILLGLYMMDWLPIRLPVSVSSKLQKLGQTGESRLGSVTGSFITGFFSALVVSPCVSAPLAGAVAGVAAVGSPMIGFLALFLLGLGLSTPLILLGATQGNFMPKAGEWMNWVKKGFALMLFAVSLLMIERVFLSPIMLVLWAVWFGVVAFWAWQWLGKGKIVTRLIAVALAIWTVCLLVGAITGETDSWQPLKKLLNKNTSTQVASKNTAQPITIHRLEELQPLIKQYPNIVVDVTAEWCIECRIMDKNLFANPPSQLQNWQVIRLDVTENNADSKAVYQALQVFGPPVLLYYQDGKLVARQNGETKRTEFANQLNALNK